MNENVIVLSPIDCFFVRFTNRLVRKRRIRRRALNKRPFGHAKLDDLRGNVIGYRSGTTKFASFAPPP